MPLCVYRIRDVILECSFKCSIPNKKNLMLKVKFKQSAHTELELDHKHSF